MHSIFTSQQTTNKTTTMLLETPLPEDLVIEILLRLPVKSRARFKCVSRHWKILILDSRFTRTHVEQHPIPNHTLFLTIEKADMYERWKSLRSVEGSVCLTENQCFPREFEEFGLVGTYHGLICFSNYTTGDARVWNPLTNQKRTFDFKSRGEGFSSFIGFGFDTINNDYKVVKIGKLLRNTVIENFEFRNTQSREIVVQLPFKLSNASVTVNGSIHWIAFHPKKKVLQIVRFNMDHEKFVEIPLSIDMPNINPDIALLPHEALALAPGLVIDDKEYVLRVFKGSLCLFISNPWRVEAWLMSCKNHDISNVAWTKLFEILLNRRSATVIGFTANDEFVVIRNRNLYHSYDPRKRRFEGTLGYHYYVNQTVSYVESCRC